MTLQSYRFSAITLTGSNFAAQYSSQSITGEIVKVQFDYGDTDSSGSLVLGVSGLGNTEEILRVNGFSADVTAYPYVYGVNNVNTALSGTNWSAASRRYVNGPLWVNGSGLLSGNTINDVVVWWEQK